MLLRITRSHQTSRMTLLGQTGFVEALYMSGDSVVIPTLTDPLAEGAGRSQDSSAALGPYDQALVAGEELRARPRAAASTVQVLRQHAKNRMTVWERIDVLQDKGERPMVLYQNW